MTIGSNTARGIFACNGTSTVFPVPIQAYNASDFLVLLTNAAGVSTVLNLGGDYTLAPSGTEAPPQWTLTTQTGQFPSPYVAGLTLQVILNPVQTQPSQYVSGQAFPSLAVQTNMDRLTEMVIRLQDQVSRAVRAPDGDNAPAMLLPAAPLRELQYLATDVNGNLITVTALPGTANTPQSLGLLLYPQSAAEIAAGVLPVNIQYAYGSFRRYGADPSGTLNSYPAILAASKCNSLIFDDFPGGGNYLIGQDGLLSAYPLTILGQAKNTSAIVVGDAGTRFTLSSAAGVSTACLHYETFATDVHIERIAFQWQNPSLPQFGLRADTDFRAFSILDCSFFGNATPGVYGIYLNFGLGGTFSSGSIRDCTLEDLMVGIDLQGPCTTVKIRDCEFYGAGPALSSYGVLIGAQPSSAPSPAQGVSLIGNTFENWTYGIYSYAGDTRQIGNYFEANTHSWTWWSGAFPVTQSFDFGSIITNGGVPQPNVDFLYNNTSGNMVLSPGIGTYFDSALFNVYRGIASEGQALADGFFTDFAPTVQANGGGTISGLTVTTACYCRIAGRMEIEFEISGTLTGGATTAIQIAIPGALFPAKTARNPCSVVINGASPVPGLAYVTGAAAQINIAPGLNTSAAWTAGAFSINGQLAFRIIS